VFLRVPIGPVRINAFVIVERVISRIMLILLYATSAFQTQQYCDTVDGDLTKNIIRTR
jgi:hypothetical protein